MTVHDADRVELGRWLERLESRHDVPIDLDLSRCGAVYRRLGSPRPADHVITVAGTNGKGSTVAWLSAILSLRGQKVGAYTSPHLLRFNERLRIAGKEIGSRELVEAFDAVEAAREDTSLTYFEHTTLACFFLMAQRDLDTAILEVGLGGRLDTVNLVDTDLAVITPIGLDHQAFLGNDRQTIGREKAGILRPGKPLVSGERRPPASVLERAASLECPVVLPGRDYELEQSAGDHERFRLGDVGVQFIAPELGAAHQRDNLACALAAAYTLFPPDSTSVDLGRGLRGVAVPGRLQRFGPDPGYWVDVGHNPMAAAAVQASLELAGRRCICVLGMLADKDAESVARLLSPSVELFVCAGLEDAWRGQGGHGLAERVRGSVGQTAVRAFPTVASAMADGRRESAARGLPVLVFGSFHTAAEAMTWLHEQGLDAPSH